MDVEWRAVQSLESWKKDKNHGISLSIQVIKTPPQNDMENIYCWKIYTNYYFNSNNMKHDQMFVMFLIKKCWEYDV